LIGLFCKLINLKKKKKKEREREREKLGSAAVRVLPRGVGRVASSRALLAPSETKRERRGK
jgi:hypothetical protein